MQHPMTPQSQLFVFHHLPFEVLITNQECAIPTFMEQRPMVVEMEPISIFLTIFTPFLV
jgi:hypothetical protein